jgi:serine/threonine protein phosphatase 1
LGCGGETTDDGDLGGRIINMTHRRIFIGDVHGHYDGLMKLLEAIDPDRSDRIYFVGDLIDRGPKSAQVVKFVKESSYQCVLGNHEQLLLEGLRQNKINKAAFQSWLYSGGHTTVASYGNPQQILEDIEWMRTLPTYIDLGDIWLVHAGVHPELPIKAQGPEDFCWIRSEFHQMSKPYFTDKLIVIGHTMTFTFKGIEPGQLALGQGWIGIDTGVYNSKSGWLTALDITQRKVYQVNVFQRCIRTLPLAQVVKKIQGDRMAVHR